MSRDDVNASAPESPASSCVVATGDGFTLTRADVEELRKHYVPSPPFDPATRLALDVWLAEWIATGSVGKASVAERIEHHNGLATRRLEERLGALEDARHRLRVTEGPCWAPVPRP